MTSARLIPSLRRFLRQFPSLADLYSFGRCILANDVL